MRRAQRSVAVGRLHVADKSAWEQMRHSSLALDRMDQLRSARRLGVCVISLAELLYSARNPQELRALIADLGTLPYVPVTPEAERRVPEVMTLLAARGHHRRPIPDLLLAATAEAAGATLLHYDSDFELIAEVTGQPHEWILPRGAGHGAD